MRSGRRSIGEPAADHPPSTYERTVQERRDIIAERGLHESQEVKIVGHPNKKFNRPESSKGYIYKIEKSGLIQVRTNDGGLPVVEPRFIEAA